MKYNHLGRSGLQVSELSLGTWLTFGPTLNFAQARECVHFAFDNGINFFDTAEVYSNGVSESILGKTLKDFNRDEVVVSTKIYWGGDKPNQIGLSRKHLIEGTKNSLKRLKMDYVDLLFCHRPDKHTPLEETVLAMDQILRQGLAFYWGTSEWSAEQIEQAFKFAKEYHLIAPTMEQPEYNMLARKRVEKEYVPLYQKHGLGTTIWSPLAAGILTGKYNKGIPQKSRLDRVSWLKKEYESYHLLEQPVFDKIDKLMRLAKELDCSPAQLAIAWCLKNPNVSTVILGASNLDQLKENLKAAEVKERLTDNVMARIEGIIA
ncbi:MAG: aldo/keto reductase [Candidatus Margulisbacteria bacterium]|nr:aldo/keto reductase [Candidatus Margulisiibacteriota bacterium]